MLTLRGRRQHRSTGPIHAQPFRSRPPCQRPHYAQPRPHPRNTTPRAALHPASGRITTLFSVASVAPPSTVAATRGAAPDPPRPPAQKAPLPHHDPCSHSACHSQKRRASPTASPVAHAASRAPPLTRAVCAAAPAPAYKNLGLLAQKSSNSPCTPHNTSPTRCSSQARPARQPT